MYAYGVPLQSLCAVFVSLFYIEEATCPYCCLCVHECVSVCVCINSTGQFLSETFLTCTDTNKLNIQLCLSGISRPLGS